jgi:hypothetical protein
LGIDVAVRGIRVSVIERVSSAAYVVWTDEITFGAILGARGSKAGEWFVGLGRDIGVVEDYVADECVC